MGVLLNVDGLMPALLQGSGHLSFMEIMALVVRAGSMNLFLTTILFGCFMQTSAPLPLHPNISRLNSEYIQLFRILADMFTTSMPSMMQLEY
ncbi:hypothetical protein Lpp126_10383 [Lacticaseibacillus paracasei subsp. paracasei Lpp126]|uniref:Uncharacterized protein n=1 Tax=Lacticaseibacillus paracasei subsp. paracasei Lpp126 TaxID=1256206 RepID=S2RC52_LACPA|nr:hypothetical protein Lpp126_10383 [Lacticaseibacillus paracasei subsp. paracasei Lpp126]